MTQKARRTERHPDGFEVWHDTHPLSRDHGRWGWRLWYKGRIHAVSPNLSPRRAGVIEATCTMSRILYAQMFKGEGIVPIFVEGRKVYPLD